MNREQIAEQIARQIAGAMMGALSESQHKTSVNLVNLEDFAATAALRALERQEKRIKSLRGLLSQSKYMLLDMGLSDTDDLITAIDEILEGVTAHES